MPLVCETDGPRIATRLVAEAHAEAFDVVAIAGGDGTINEAVNGVHEGSPPLAVVPLGTANVFAHELGVPLDMDACARMVAEGSVREVHMGAIDGRRFTMMAGVGFDAHVVNKVTTPLKRRLGKLAYVAKSVEAMIKYDLDDYELEIDGRRVRAASAVIAKGHYYGGTFSCAPDARLADPTFRVCLFRSGGGWNALRYAIGLVAGRLAKFDDVEIVIAREVRIAGRANEPVQADGEIVATLPVIATIDPTPLRVVAPGAA